MSSRQPDSRRPTSEWRHRWGLYRLLYMLYRLLSYAIVNLRSFRAFSSCAAFLHEFCFCFSWLPFVFARVFINSCPVFVVRSRCRCCWLINEHKKKKRNSHPVPRLFAVLTGFYSQVSKELHQLNLKLCLNMQFPLQAPLSYRSIDIKIKLI